MVRRMRLRLVQDTTHLSSAVPVESCSVPEGDTCDMGKRCCEMAWKRHVAWQQFSVPALEVASQGVIADECGRSRAASHQWCQHQHQARLLQKP